MRLSPGPTKPMDCSESSELALSVKTNAQLEESMSDGKMSNEILNNSNQSITLVSGVSYMNKMMHCTSSKTKDLKFNIISLF
jgi:hypothetical protein